MREKNKWWKCEHSGTVMSWKFPLDFLVAIRFLLIELGGWPNKEHIVTFVGKSESREIFIRATFFNISQHCNMCSQKLFHSDKVSIAHNPICLHLLLSCNLTTSNIYCTILFYINVWHWSSTHKSFLIFL